MKIIYIYEEKGKKGKKEIGVENWKMNRRDKKIKNNTFKEKMKIYMGRKN